MADRRDDRDIDDILDDELEEELEEDIKDKKGDKNRKSSKRKAKEDKDSDGLHKLLMLNLQFKIAVTIAVVLVIAFIVMKVCNFHPVKNFFGGAKDKAQEIVIGEEGKVSTISEISLAKVLSVSELSTISFTYESVATKYGTGLEYFVAYDGSVKAGIDFSDIDITIDDDNKVITIKLPEIKIYEPVVDYGSMQFIFKDSKSETQTVATEAYELCKEDIAVKVDSDEDIKRLAYENTKNVVGALVEPWVSQIDSEYKINIK